MKSAANDMVTTKSEQEIELMRECCEIVSDVIRLTGSQISPGVITEDLDRMAEEFIRSCGARPAFKGYAPSSGARTPFPATLCISVDDAVVHGMPSKRKLEEGEIVSIDVGVEKNGYFGDGAATFPVGKIDPEKERLMRVTRESLFRGIEQARPGNRLHDISSAIQRYVEENGFSIVRDLVGHGIGTRLHEDPPVPNFGKRGTGIKLTSGMALAIEPMVNYGGAKVKVGRDGWTVLSRDGLPSAHFEHTIVITENGPLILTNHIVEDSPGKGKWRSKAL